MTTQPFQAAQTTREAYSPAIRLKAVTTAYPPYRVTQEDALGLARELMPRWMRFQSMVDVFRNAQIEGRSTALPPEAYFSLSSAAQKAAAFKEWSRKLAVQAGKQALEQAGVSPQEVDAMVTVTTTGFLTPSLSVGVALDLGCSPHVAQYPLVGYGCAGGVLGLAAALDLARAGYRNVLLINVELCTLNILHSDESKSNFVALALFADGASACLIGPGEQGPQLVDHHNTLLRDTEGVMGWNTADDGLQVVFGVEVPEVVMAHLDSTVQNALTKFGWQREDIQHFLPHPGGVKVLNAIETVLGLPQPLEDSRAVLRAQGNMSSVSVMAVLERAIRVGKTGQALLTAMGPGFNIAHVAAIL